MSEEETRIGPMWPCMVCGKPAPACAPLTICSECKHTDKAEIVRLRHKAWFWERRAKYQEMEIEAVEIYLAEASEEGGKP